MVAARIATIDDVASLVELRLLHLAHFGWESSATSTETKWLSIHRARIEDGVRSGALVAAVVDIDGSSVAGGIAEIVSRLPSPGNPTGAVAHISSMFTMPEHRRRGLGRSVVRELVEELHRRGYLIIELNVASRQVEAIYRSEGFSVRQGVRSMRHVLAPGHETRR